MILAEWSTKVACEITLVKITPKFSFKPLSLQPIRDLVEQRELKESQEKMEFPVSLVNQEHQVRTVHLEIRVLPERQEIRERRELKVNKAVLEM